MSKATLKMLKPSVLHESPMNPRKTFEDVDDLTESVREKGILQPLVVRERLTPAGNSTRPRSYEVLIGARRRRAAIRAELETVPCMVRDDVDDDLALEIMVIENSQRVDVDPFEESAGIAALVGRGRDVGDVADALGRPERWVRRRLTLRDATEGMIERYRTGNAALGAIEQLLHCPDDVRATALSRLGGLNRWTRGAVRREINDASLRMDSAPWELTDAALPGGPCNLCPKRTGAQLDVFGTEDGDRCLDSACWQTREAAWLERTRKTSTVVEVKQRWHARERVPLLSDYPTAEECEALGVERPANAPPKWRDVVKSLGGAVPRSAVVIAPYYKNGKPEVRAGVSREDLADMLTRQGKVAAAERFRPPAAPDPEDLAESKRRRKEELAAQRKAAKAARARWLKTWMKATPRERLVLLVRQALGAKDVPKDVDVAGDDALWEAIGGNIYKRNDWRIDELRKVLREASAAAAKAAVLEEDNAA